MGTQNLVSAELSEEKQNSILTHLNGIKADLASIVIPMEKGEKKTHINVGSVMLPFLELSKNTANSHPEILPAIFDKEEFNRDVELAIKLTPILTLLTEIGTSIQNTLDAAKSDSMVESLDVYSSVQQNEGKVAGLNVIADEMRSYFKRSKREKPESK